MEVTDLPALNAALNGAAAICLVIGFVLIRRRRWRAHRAAMVTALALSALFLVSYLVYHAQVGSVRFQGVGPVRTVYFSILLTHTVFAAAVPILAVWTVVLAARGRLVRHRRLARWALPIWLYVSVTGVVIYLMLYHLPV